MTPPTCPQSLVLGGGDKDTLRVEWGNHVAQFNRLLVASLLFILSGPRVGDL